MLLSPAGLGDLRWDIELRDVEGGHWWPYSELLVRLRWLLRVMLGDADLHWLCLLLLSAVLRLVHLLLAGEIGHLHLDRLVHHIVQSFQHFLLDPVADA